MPRKYTPEYAYHNGRIDDRFASPPEGAEGENTHYAVGFKHYSEKKSDLTGARPADLRKIFEFLCHIGRCQQYNDIKTKVAQEIKPVNDDNHYSKYFSGLTSDVELMEFDVGDRRGFFFFDHPAKLLQMVAIDKHPEYKKQKRR